MLPYHGNHGKLRLWSWSARVTMKQEALFVGKGWFTLRDYFQLVFLKNAVPLRLTELPGHGYTNTR